MGINDSRPAIDLDEIVTFFRPILNPPPPIICLALAVVSYRIHPVKKKHLIKQQFRNQVDF